MIHIKQVFTHFVAKTNQSRFTCFWGKFWTEIFICVTKLTLCNSDSRILQIAVSCWFFSSFASLPLVEAESLLGKSQCLSLHSSFLEVLEWYLLCNMCTAHCAVHPFGVGRIIQQAAIVLYTAYYNSFIRAGRNYTMCNTHTVNWQMSLYTWILQTWWNSRLK